MTKKSDLTCQSLKIDYFKKYDKDNNLNLDYEEFKSLILQLSKDYPDLLNKFDENKNGELDDEEIKALFKKADANGDNELTYDELESIIGIKCDKEDVDNVQPMDLTSLKNAI